MAAERVKAAARMLPYAAPLIPMETSGNGISLNWSTVPGAIYPVQHKNNLMNPESRLLKTGQVGYNVQVAVDAKHDLIVESEVVQDANDLKQLSPMAQLEW